MNNVTKIIAIEINTNKQAIGFAGMARYELKLEIDALEAKLADKTAYIDNWAAMQADLEALEKLEDQAEDLRKWMFSVHHDALQQGEVFSIPALLVA